MLGQDHGHKFTKPDGRSNQNEGFKEKEGGINHEQYHQNGEDDPGEDSLLIHKYSGGDTLRHTQGTAALPLKPPSSNPLARIVRSVYPVGVNPTGQYSLTIRIQSKSRI